jgi:glycosyltransferase involved in cell wall biosynthesis
MAIKVFLQYPWKFPDSSYYKNFLENPSSKVDYINYSKDKGKKMEIIGSSKKFESMRKFKNVLRKILGVIQMPNITFTPNTDADLIHCAHCLSLNKKPWVVDTEVYDRVSAGGNIAYSLIGKAIIRNRLKSKYCKRIIAWSEDCKKSFEDAFPKEPEILKKITIVPFALPTKKFKKIDHKEKIILLFVARWFDAKGGRQTLEVFDRLTKIYKNIECLFICPTIDEFKKRFSTNQRIKIMDLMPQEKLFKEIYPLADIFVYPGFGDSYGFAMPEAMAFGLPIVTVDSYARREIVQDGKTGFIIERPKSYKDYSCMDEKMLDELVKKTSVLIENKSLRDRMGKTAMREVKSGKFSIKNQQKLLLKIYKEALCG